MSRKQPKKCPSQVPASPLTRPCGWGVRARGPDTFARKTKADTALEHAITSVTQVNSQGRGINVRDCEVLHDACTWEYSADPDPIRTHFTARAESE